MRGRMKLSLGETPPNLAIDLAVRALSFNSPTSNVVKSGA
jgi:hypothetical protein